MQRCARHLAKLIEAGDDGSVILHPTAAINYNVCPRIQASRSSIQVLIVASIALLRKNASHPTHVAIRVGFHSMAVQWYAY